MGVRDLVDVLGALALVALVSTFLVHKDTGEVVSGFGKVFSDSLRASQGR